LDSPRQQLVETLRKLTTLEARILWEDRTGLSVRSSAQEGSSRWTALLPVLTGRTFIGGLDSEARLEHAYASLVDQELAGRPVGEWGDAELAQFCRRYNIGRVVCWSSAAVERLKAWPDARLIETLSDDSGPRYLFALSRAHSYLLKGRARWLHADCERIALADVAPEDGKVVLSLHYQAGMTASPGWVKIEREPDPNDPIPLIRLVVPTPVARITLRWRER